MPDENQQQKRQVAQKARINDILSGRYVKEEGWTPNYIKTPEGKKISRVNIVGVVVSKNSGEENNYRSIIIDDGSGTISARTFEDNISLANLDIGNIVLIIGRPREYGDEKYILIEIIKKIDNEKWLQLRKLELGSVKEQPEIVQENNIVKEETKIEEESIQEDVVEDIYEKVLGKIKELDKGDGADFDEVIKDIEEGEKIVNELLKKGEVFETSPGKIKVLE